MKRTFKLLSIFSVLVTSLVLTSCLKSKTNKKKNTVNTNTFNTQPTNQFNPPTRDNPPGEDNDNGGNYGNNGPTGEGFTPYAPCVADSGQTIDCYLIDEISFHGADDGVVVWSSETDLSGFNPNNFFTNSRFNLEVIPRYKNKGVDSKGNECKYYPQPFNRLQVGVRIRSTDSGASDYFLFDNVAVDKASYVHEFSPPQNSSTPLVVDVMNVKWDWSCQDYANQGFPDYPGVCPYDNVWRTECIKLEIRFSTDGTKDLPGPRR